MNEEIDSLTHPFIFKKSKSLENSEDVNGHNLVNQEKIYYANDTVTKKDSSSNNENWHTFITSISEGNLAGSVFCLLCLTFGSAILALPYSITKTGLILAFLLFFFASFVVYWTLWFLIYVANKNGILNYSSLILKYFGKNQANFYEIMNLSSNMGAIIIYQQIISNFILSALQYLQLEQIQTYPVLSRFIQMTIFAVFTQIPITLIKHIEVLHKISFLGTFSLLYSVIVAIVEFPFYFMENYNYQRILFFKFDWNVVGVICLFFFGFANHNAILNVLSDLKNPNKKRCTKVLKYSYNVEFYTYVIIMIVGYFSTFEMTNEIFIDRPGESIFMIMGKLLYVISLTCHIGLYYYISRPSLEYLFNSSEKFSEKQNMFYGIIIILSLNCIAFWFKSIVSIISFFGATVNIYLMFIMPVLLYLKCTAEKAEQKKYSRILAVFILIVSCSIGFTYVTTLILDTFINVY